MPGTEALSFLAVITILTLAPGADTMLVLRNVLTYGRRAGIITAAGICSGLFVHATLSALGLSLILLRSSLAFTVVKIAGACYLILLGFWSLWQVLRQWHRPLSESNLLVSASAMTLPPAEQPIRYHRSVYLQGLLTNVLNPKVAIFYLAFLPQFISRTDPVLLKSLLLAGIHLSLGMLWLSLVSLLVGALRSWITRTSIRHALESLVGLVLVGFGLRLAFEQR